MAIRITCPACKASYAVDGSVRGKQIQCRECQKPMNIPAAKPPNADASRPAGAGSSGAYRSAPSKSAPVDSALPPPVESRTRPRREGRRRRDAEEKSDGISPVWLIVGGVAVLGFLLIGVIAVVAIFVL